MKPLARTRTTALTTFLAGLLGWGAASSAPLNLAEAPLFVTQGVPPLVLLVAGKNHKLYYEAYNDASDLDGDGDLDVGYNPDEIDYYGYFDSNKCYTHNGNEFVPAGSAANKQCNGQWSGDFLNYLTTSRMDALRKVLYGGFRSTDDEALTILQRAYIPQDAHSWGKEYQSVARDGYDIRQYAPLALPVQGTRHLFANTALSDNGTPLLRVLTDSQYRIWQWVSIERPVAGDECSNDANQRANCATPGGTFWEVVPPDAFQNLIQTTYNTRDFAKLSTDPQPCFAAPTTQAQYDTFVSMITGDPTRRFGSGSVLNISGVGNPFGADQCYLTLFQGQLVVPSAGAYTFAVDGDDAVELIIDGQPVAAWYGLHASCNGDQPGADLAACTDNAAGDPNPATVNLTAGVHTIEFRHQENLGQDNYWLYWKRVIPPSAMTDYAVRVQVCMSSMPEGNCEQYPSGEYKPTGLLHRYGETDRMFFGLLTGSYHHNLSGGVLRKNVESFSDEVDPDTGQFTDVVGIAKTFDRLRVAGFDYGCPYCYTDPPGIVTRPIEESDGQGYQMWGNPIAEMMYEGARYFAGKASPTTDFSSGVSGAGTFDSLLDLPLPTWVDPFGDDQYPWCAKPFMLVLSDINPSYDTDQVPGTAFGSFSGDLSGFSASSEANEISAEEPEVPGEHFIGQVGNDADGACTPKTVTGLGNVRGLCPEEPTKQGGYYSASVAYFGRTNDLNPVDGGVTDQGQKMQTFAVALASPLPHVDIQVRDGVVTLVPFAKSVGGCNIDEAGTFRPTNQIVDFFVEQIGPTSGTFRINFEDTEQGSDHDMDSIVRYTYVVNNDSTVTVSLESRYGAGCVAQHIGYIISGTTADGTYLEVRDCDTAGGSCGNEPDTDPDYFLDTPPDQPPGGMWNDGEPLPLVATRTFSPSGNPPATLLRDPLWYAAKWGGFQDNNANDLPDLDAEWDGDQDGNPDNYFLVTNAGTLSEQLESSFEEIIDRAGSAASGTTNTGVLTAESRFYQVRFNSGNWTGQLLSFPINLDGSLDTTGDGPLGSDWDAGDELSGQDWNSGRDILTLDPATRDGTAFRWDSLGAGQQDALNHDPDGGAADTEGEARLNYVRGDDSNEGTGNNYRVRPSLLADIVNSEPFFVGPPPFRYPDSFEAQAYSTFRFNNLDRPAMVYVGANGGMMHGFDALTGEEKIAYVPSEMFRPRGADSWAPLAELTSPNYHHRYFVDAPATAGDIFLGGEWRTVLVGGLGGGGQDVYALDVTHPDTMFAENNAANVVLWEFTDVDHPDLGYTFGQPSIVKMHNGQWAAILGNGYNNTEDDDNGACDDNNAATPCTVSDNGRAKLYILFISAGTDGTWDAGDFIVIDTEAGTQATPNGLSTPAPVDTNGDFIVDYIYAGDLLGNLWKFDVRDPNTGQWKVAFKTGNTPAPLFVATDASGVRQPITIRPEVGFQPEGLGGYVVYFGTGKYLEGTDVSSTAPQAFYGVYDRNDGTRPTRAQLVQQEVIETVISFDQEWRVTSDDPVPWCEPSVNTCNCSGNTPKCLGWYLDLPEQGERSVSDPVLRNQRIIFTTLTPSDDVCLAGGSGWLMELDIQNGGRPEDTEPFFDVNNDGEFNENDTVQTTQVDVDDDGSADEVAPTGRRSEVGIIPTPTIVSDIGNRVEYKYSSGSTGGTEVIRNNPGRGDLGRQSWRQMY